MEVVYCFRRLKAVDVVRDRHVILYVREDRK